MTLPSSGPLSFSALQGEFGGSNPISLSEYYRGGGLVPNISANSSVPTSGIAHLSNFYGTKKQVPITFDPSTPNPFDVEHSTSGFGSAFGSWDDVFGPIFTGGQAPFTFSWTNIFGAGPTMRCSNTGIQFPTFHGEVFQGGVGTSTAAMRWNCHIASSDGQTADFVVDFGYSA